MLGPDPVLDVAGCAFPVRLQRDPPSAGVLVGVIRGRACVWSGEIAASPGAPDRPQFPCFAPIIARL